MLQLSVGQEQDLEALAKEAGQILMSYWPKGTKRKEFKEIRKPDGSLVTTADYESNALLEKELKLLFPNSGILSEETGETPPRKCGHWIIDPLDGTSVFAKGDDYFRVLISYAEEGRVGVGIAYFPVPDIYFFSAKGKGMWKNGSLLRVSTNTSIEKERIHTDQPIAGITDSANKVFKDGGSALLSVCEGKLDAAVFNHNEVNVWDIAPFVCMIEESGGMGFPSTVDLWKPHTGRFWGANQYIGRLLSNRD